MISTMKKSVLKEIGSWAEILVCAFLLAIFINGLIIANSTVPTGSMETTIMSGDRVIGSRLRYTFSEPERGDIAIFSFGWICENCKKARGEGEAPAVCPHCGREIHSPKRLYYVKRVIGIPGDHIEIRDDGGFIRAKELVSDLGISDPDRQMVTAAIYVNGEKLEEPYLHEPMLYTGDLDFDVPEGSYFMLGDNRNNSLDARFWEDPYISSEKMIAKVLFRYFPGFKKLV